jgi:hypothetical protein
MASPRGLSKKVFSRTRAEKKRRKRAAAAKPKK